MDSSGGDIFSSSFRAWRPLGRSWSLRKPQELILMNFVWIFNGFWVDFELIFEWILGSFWMDVGFLFKRKAMVG